jgi:N-acetylglucosaminyl-diphospho-decaprenol L-rhamnosyltransferase
MNNQQLAIIIVTFNSSAIILSCLEKIDLQKYETIIIDNKSTDDTLALVKNHFPFVKIIVNEKNIGYGRANNIGLKSIKTDYALILNPDAFIFSADITKIISKMQQDQQIALAGPLLLNYYPYQEQDAKQELNIVKNNAIEVEKDFISVKYIIGAILFFNMSIFRQIGFFDEKIFLYYEDDEISHRVVQNNYKVAIFSEIFGYHIGSGSSGKNLRSLYKRFWHRALSKFYWKEKQKGKSKTIFSAVKLSFSFFVKILCYAIVFNKIKIVQNLASLCGTISYLARLTAFDKNDNPRA